MERIKKLLAVGLPCLALLLFASSPANPCNYSTCEHPWGSLIEVYEDCSAQCGNCNEGYYCCLDMYFNGQRICEDENCCQLV